MKVWIDLSNSPHAQFFAPLVRELTARGVQVQITARQFTQTLPLAARLGLDVTAVGAAEKVSKLLKPINILRRAALLRSWARAQRFCAAISHGSYGGQAASRSDAVADTYGGVARSNVLSDSRAGYRASAQADGLGVSVSGWRRQSDVRVRSISRGQYLGQSRSRAVSVKVR